MAPQAMDEAEAARSLAYEVYCLSTSQSDLFRISSRQRRRNVLKNLSSVPAPLFVEPAGVLGRVELLLLSIGLSTRPPCSSGLNFGLMSSIGIRSMGHIQPCAIRRAISGSMSLQSDERVRRRKGR